MNEDTLETTQQQRKLPKWMAMQSKGYAIEKRKVCISLIILSDGKFNVNLTVKSSLLNFRPLFTFRVAVV